MKFAICNEIFQGWTLPDTFAYAKKAGYDAVEIAPFTLAPRITDVSPARRVEIREAAARAGVAISGLHWLLAQTEGLYLTHTDPTIRRITSEYFVELVRCNGDLGGRFMILGSPKQRNLLPGVTTEQAADWAIEGLRPAVTLAEDLGITLCFEPLAPSETNFINTAREARELTSRMNSRAFQIILDVKAMSSEAMSIPEIIRESRGRFSYFHANDANLKGPGFGEVDFHPIAAALREVGYDGYVSVEVFKFEEGAERIATKSREYLRRTFGE
jgi:sugar phosphate isomerase/epimerase